MGEDMTSTTSTYPAGDRLSERPTPRPESRGRFGILGKLWFQVVLGMGLGIVLGVVSPGLGAQMKPFGDAFIVKSGAATPMEMLHYPMSLPTTLQVCGIDSMQVLQQALDAVRTFQPLTAEQRDAIVAKTAKVAADGSTERYKTSHHFDGTVQNPQWLG